jgi:hypothetical protein
MVLKKTLCQGLGGGSSRARLELCKLEKATGNNHPKNRIHKQPIISAWYGLDHKPFQQLTA